MAAVCVTLDGVALVAPNESALSAWMVPSAAGMAFVRTMPDVSVRMHGPTLTAAARSNGAVLVAVVVRDTVCACRDSASARKPTREVVVSTRCAPATAADRVFVVLAPVNAHLDTPELTARQRSARRTAAVMGSASTHTNVTVMLGMEGWTAP